MTREVKFRAWDGEQMRYLSNMFVGVGQIGFSDEHYVDLSSMDQEQVTLMQYTGLCDLRGTVIYEDDIVRIKFHDGPDAYSYELGVIRWHEPSSAFKWFALEEDPSDGNNYWLTHADADNREVIGNIHANPELLATD